MDYSNLKVSEHARRRFVERKYGTKDRDEVTNTINREERYIDSEILRLIGIAHEFYMGPTAKNEQLSVVNTENWLFLIDPKTKKVVTLYSIDLGLGMEYNLDYLSKIKEKLDEHKAEHVKVIELQASKAIYDRQRKIVTTDINNTVNEIDKAEETLKKLKKKKEELMRQMEDLNTKISAVDADVETFEDDSPQIINTLLQRQVF